MKVPSPHSPADATFDELRTKGECVTAHHDLSRAGQPVVPVLSESQAPEVRGAIPHPKHEEMPDG